MTPTGYSIGGTQRPSHSLEGNGSEEDWWSARYRGDEEGGKVLKGDYIEGYQPNLNPNGQVDKAFLKETPPQKPLVLNRFLAAVL